MLERCQRDYRGDLRPCDGEAGPGVYAYPAGDRAMRAYYGARGEDVVEIFPLPEARIVDLTAPAWERRLLAVARALDPRATRADLHRRQWAIRGFMAREHPGASGYVVRHRGPGLPAGRQVVITRPEHFRHRIKGGPDPEGAGRGFPEGRFPAAPAATPGGICR